MSHKMSYQLPQDAEDTQEAATFKNQAQYDASPSVNNVPDTDEEEDNDELVEWVQGVCLPEYGVIDGMVANFIDNLQDAKFT